MTTNTSKIYNYDAKKSNNRMKRSMIEISHSLTSSTPHISSRRSKKNRVSTTSPTTFKAEDFMSHSIGNTSTTKIDKIKSKNLLNSEKYHCKSVTDSYKNLKARLKHITMKKTCTKKTREGSCYSREAKKSTKHTKKRSEMHSIKKL